MCQPRRTYEDREVLKPFSAVCTWASPGLISPTKRGNRLQVRFISKDVKGVQKVQETTDDFPTTLSGPEQPHSVARDTMIDRMGLPRRDAGGIVSASRAISGDHCLSIKLCRSGYSGLVKDL